MERLETSLTSEKDNIRHFQHSITLEDHGV